MPSESPVSPLRIIRPRDISPGPSREPKPAWLKVRAPGSPNYLRLKGLMKELRLNTVCEEARCPNIGECWHHGTATFMILGDVCTRACGYCAVPHGMPATLDAGRAGARRRRGRGRWDCSTSSSRRSIATTSPTAAPASSPRRSRASARRCPSCRIEVLIPDFQGNEASLRTVLDAGPDVLNHNTETVPRLYRLARPGGRYPRTLELLDRARTIAPQIPTKTGLMVGLGEEWDEIVETLRRPAPRRRRRSSPSASTCGRRQSHLRMVRYYHPDEFAELKRIALDLGFGHVESGPLVRSSYHAHEQADALAAARG